jgi:hypothetical protein
MKRLLVVLLTAAVLSGCGAHAATQPTETEPAAACTPPAGGRCATDVAWTGTIGVSADGRHLGGIVLCGGTLHATETDGRVTIRLHVGALGPGAMACARVPVRVALDAPLGHRVVVDAASGRTIRVTPIQVD